ncbi:MAG: TonB family protein [Xanthomonadales bacterium]|nr:TonB family protein [Xanthomonadales bacterium]
MHDALYALLELNLAAAFAIVVVALLRTRLRSRFGAGAALGLWLLVPAAMLATLIPPRRVVIEVATAHATAFVGGQPPSLPPSAGVASLWVFLGGVYALGVAIVLLRALRQQHRFQHTLGSLSVWRGRILRSTQPGSSPVVLRPWRPVIVLPSDFRSRFDIHQQRWMLAHERSHLRRGDLWIQVLATLLRALCWFNPLVHWAETQCRRDLELAADADVIRRFPQARRRYAEALLNVQLAAPGLPVGCLWQSSHPLKERIMMLSRAPTPLRHPAIAPLLTGTLAVLVGGLSWAGQPGQPSMQTADQSAQQPTHSATLTLTYGDEVTHPEVHFRDEARIAAELGSDDRAVTVELQLDRQGSGFRLRSAISRQGSTVAAQRFDFEQNTRFNQVVTIDGLDASVLIEGIVAPLPRAEVLPSSGGTEGASLGRSAAEESSDPKPIHQPAPAYPSDAEAEGLAGKVVIEVSIDREGRVSRAKVHTSSGHRSLDAAARDSVSSWIFAPARRDGVAIPAQVVVPICFSLSDGDDVGCTVADPPQRSITI